MIARKIRKPLAYLLEQEARDMLELYRRFAERVDGKLRPLSEALMDGAEASYTLSQLRRVRANIAAETKRLARDIGAWEKKEYPQMYGAGQVDALLDMGGGTAQIGFARGVLSRQAMRLLSEEIHMLQGSKLHRGALSVLEKSLYSGVNINATVARRYDDVFRAFGLEIASGLAVGDETWRQAMRRELALFERMNIKSFTDKAGRDWKLSSYAEMVSRTVAMHVMNVGKMNEFLEMGEDLVVVSDFSPTCPLCAPWGGAVLSISGATKGYPAVSEAEAAGLLHPRCLPGGVLVSGPRFSAHYSRWYEGKLVVLKTRGGDELPCTPNHPVLTPKGWVAAGMLDVGDKVVKYVGGQGSVLGFDPDNVEVPTLIEDAANALLKSGEMSSARVPVSPEDFHGDGVDGEVDVVYSDSRKQGDADAESGRELINRLAGKIELLDVVDIQVRDFHGHVYNLQTEMGWYAANNIITHNCLHSFSLYLPEVWGKPDKDGKVARVGREAEGGGEPDGGIRITGAGGAIARSDYNRMEKHAERYYEAIRRRKSESDVEAIARNTGFSVEDVRKIRRHVFMDVHDLGDRGIQRFDPSFDMAVSWQNLADGKNIREMDIVMLHHELEELKLMAQGLDYDTAHETVQKVYNYQKYVRELDAREGVF